MTNLINYLPEFWHSIAEMSAIQNGISPQLDVQKNDCSDILNQCFVVSATWGLGLWENELGIIRNSELSYAERRAAIITKLLGTTTSTVKLINTLSEKITGTKCEIIEKNTSYMFTVHFLKPYGIPPNLISLRNAIEECKPAHLNFDYAYTYTLWIEVKSITWGKFKEMTWGQAIVYEGE